ncbi:cytochrome b [Roseateles koreensis]|uniref:Cytochrome b/b6 domain-containing protein n=1 Tax=Roseateles koreensis TaxID=2987526 RepID=A0ABT5KR48_9BURK|nr:cytochrome b/b6 domain-containing protein [Roseateles koreensis]MDC8785388.1 cytochrome b/b6 domain-containing protein [Roseateles koreensis]
MSHPTSRPSTPGTPAHYDRRTIIFHWLSALLVLGLWVVGQTIDNFAKGDPRVMVRSLHISLGGVLAMLLVLRLRWRRNGGTQLPAANPGLQGRLAIGVHHLLYLLLAAVLAVGIACVWIRGDNLFNLFTVPAYDPANKSLRHDAVELHELLANTLLVVAALHAAAALAHHFLLKDGVLRRMWPGRG